MPECLSPETHVFIRRKGWVSRVTLEQVAQLPELPEVLSPTGWVRVHRVWRTCKPAISIQAGKVERVICSYDHRFPVSSDRRRTKIRLERAVDIRHVGYADYLLYCPIMPFLNPTVITWMGRPLGYDLGFLVGAYAAEGGRQDRGFGIKLTVGAHEDAFVTKIQQAVGLYGLAFTEVANDARHYRDLLVSSEWMSNTFDAFVTGKVRTKSLNMEVILNTPQEFRRGILDGYVTGDGSARKGGGWIIGSASRRLRDDVATLASSLGIITSKGNRKNTDIRTGQVYSSHTLWTPYMTRRKVKSGTDGIYQVTPRSRRDIEEDREMIDIEVDGGVFLIGDGLVTHNSVTDRCTKAWEHVLMLTKSERYFADMEAVKEKFVDERMGCPGSPSPKAAKIPGQTPHTIGSKAWESSSHGRNIRSVWTIATEAYPEAHFATFPTKLAETCIKIGSSEKGCCPICKSPWVRVVEKKRQQSDRPARGKALTGPRHDGNPWNEANGRGFMPTVTTETGWRPTCDHNQDPVPCTVLDPFAGAGTTLLVADRLGRNSIGIELNGDYCRMARERIIGDAPLLNAMEDEPSSCNPPA